MNLLVYIEQHGGEPKRGSLEVLGEARRIAERHGGEVIALVTGSALGPVTDRLKRCGAHTLLVADHPVYTHATAEAIADDIVAAIDTHGVGAVLLSATAVGRELGAYVAADKGVGVAADCTRVERKGERFQVERPVYAGKAVLTLDLPRSPQVITLRPNYGAPFSDPGPGAEVRSVAPRRTPAELRVRLKEVIAEGEKKVDLTEAEIIVSGGRGMKGPENYAILEDLARAVGGVVGASRAAVDAGWRPHADQVGQTGKTVSPKLYFACGISGAIQHLAGMSSSRCIVAINKDRNAPIFQIATYGLVGDLFEVVPALTRELARLRR